MNYLVKLVLNFPDKPWDWYGLSRNLNVTFDIVERHPDKPWDWKGLSWNPNVTFDIVESLSTNLGTGLH